MTQTLPPAQQPYPVRVRRLLDRGMPFHAHEVLEDAWKTAPEETRALWKGLAQLTVGVTHAARGNVVGAVALLTRGAEHVEPYRDEPPYGIDITALVRWAHDHVAILSRSSASAAPEYDPDERRCHT